jgi:hypothetical protein
MNAIEPSLEIVQLRSTELTPNIGGSLSRHARTRFDGHRSVALKW